MKTILLLLFAAVSTTALAQDVSVVQAEYFFDADNGIGQNTLVNVTPAADGTFPFTASITGLSVGYHKLYIRTKDNNGKWSQTTMRNVEVFTPLPKTVIVSGEYFIDADPGFGAAMPITVTTPDSVILQNFAAAIVGLSVGYHKLYGRFMDNFGRWSQTFRRNIEVYENDTSYVYKAEYFFKTDNGYGNCTEVTLSKPSVDGTFSFNIPLSQVPAGADTTLFIRVQDSTEGKWSLTVLKDSARILPLTLLSFTAEKQSNIAQLNWITANEINTSYFNVQRSTDGRNFTTVGKIKAKSNSQVNSNYSFTDDISQLPAGKIYYRLQMMDRDGKFSYSKIQYIDISSTLQIAVSPNPVVSNTIRLSIYSPENAELQVSIFNELGRLVHNEQFSVLKGKINKTLSLSNLTAGVYMIRMTDGFSIRTTTLIKQ